MIETILDYCQCSPLSLWGPFFLLLVCGLGLPLPEDVALIAAGALGALDDRSWVQVSLVMYLGVIGGDTLVFLAGRFLGMRLRAMPWLRRFFPEEKQAKIEAFFAKHGSVGLFFGRFLPGLRCPIFFTAGSMRVSYLKFLCLDGFAALVSVPVFVWLGHWLWSTLQGDSEILEGAMALARACYGWIFVAIVLIAGFGWWRARRPVSLVGR